MKGHEYARTLVRDHLEATLPARLAGIRSALSVNDPVDPESYLLADTLPIDASKYPIVLVQSTSLTDMRATESGAVGVWICEYAVQVVVACRSNTAGAWEDASRQRDRLMLAARESLMTARGLGDDDAYVITQGMTEEIGEAAQDVQSRPLAAGQLTLRVRVAEELTDPVGTVTTTEVIVDNVTTNPDGDITPVIDPPVEE